MVRDNPLLLFIGVQNVTNRRNASTPIWNRRVNTVDTNEQLGSFPLVGFGQQPDEQRKDVSLLNSA